MKKIIHLTVSLLLLAGITAGAQDFVVNNPVIHTNPAFFPVGTKTISFDSYIAQQFTDPRNAPAGNEGNNSSGISTYSASVLPVIGLDFNAGIQSDCSTLITWRALSEINVKNYILEYSRDAVTYEEIYTVAAEGVNSRIYSTRHNADGGKSFYRVKAVDIDGDTEYSRVIMLVSKCNKSVMAAYPNPANDNLNISIAGADAKGALVAVYMASGQLAASATYQTGISRMNVTNLPAGMYVVRIQSASESRTEKIIIKH